MKLNRNIKFNIFNYSFGNIIDRLQPNFKKYILKGHDRQHSYNTS